MTEEVTWLSHTGERKYWEKPPSSSWTLLTFRPLLWTCPWTRNSCKGFFCSFLFTAHSPGSAFILLHQLYRSHCVILEGPLQRRVKPEPAVRHPGWLQWTILARAWGDTSRGCKGPGGHTNRPISPFLSCVFAQGAGYTAGTAAAASSCALGETPHLYLVTTALPCAETQLSRRQLRNKSRVHKIRTHMNSTTSQLRGFTNVH